MLCIKSVAKILKEDVDKTFSTERFILVKCGPQIEEVEQQGRDHLLSEPRMTLKMPLRAQKPDLGFPSSRQAFVVEANQRSLQYPCSEKPGFRTTFRSQISLFLAVNRSR